MDWLNIIFGFSLISIGLVWLEYELKRRKRLKREDKKFILATQPRYFLGIFILIVSGITIIFRAL